MRESGKLKAKLTFKESFVLAAKIAEEKEADDKESLRKEALEKKSALKTK